MSRIIKTPPLFDHQKAVVKILDEHPNENIKVVVKSSRQKGKTFIKSLENQYKTIENLEIIVNKKNNMMLTIENI